MLGLMLACSAPELELSPDHGSARGGETVEITGARVPREPEVFFDGLQAEVLERSRRALTVRTPPGIAGLATVRLERWREPEGVFAYEPLELLYEAGPEDYLPPLTGLSSAVMHDVDGDGVRELVTVAEGRLAIWRNTGFGAFEATEDPGFGDTVVAVASGGGGLYVCQADRGPRLLGSSDAPPAEPGCRGAWWVDGQWIERRDEGLRRYEGTRRLGEGSDDACAPVEGGCTVTDGVATLQSGALVYTLPPGVTGVAIRRKGSLTVTLGEEPHNADSTGWGEWAQDTDAGTVRLDAKLAEVDAVWATFGELDRVLLEDFELWPLDVDYPGVPAAVPGGLAVAGANGVELFDEQGLVPGRFDGACAAGGAAAVDVDGDGVDELFVACEGQDLLFRYDGAFWFEDHAAALPLDDAPGRAVSWADLDLDGLPELLVATEGVDRLYHATDDGFEDWSARTPLTVDDSVVLLPEDVDQDGDLDLLVVREQGLALWAMTL